MRLKTSTSQDCDKARKQWQQPLPCPFCGQDKLFTGHDSADAMTVTCLWWNSEGEIIGCGAKMVVRFPYYRPRSCKTWEEVDAHVLRQAIKKWNRRVKTK